MPHRVRVAVTAQSPPLSSTQNQEYTHELSGIPRQFGGSMGCAYTGFSHGIVCQNTGGLPDYKQSPASFRGDWAANVRPGFPHPPIQSPGGLAQIAMGGGSGSPECAQVCSCLGDSNCPCRNGPGQTCGYASVNQTCVEPFPGGQYGSLSECERANARGFYKQ